MCSKERCFIGFCAFLDFLLDFGSIFDEFSMSKLMYVCTSACVFLWTGDPHETLYFTIRNLLFHVLYFSFLSEQMLEIECKTRPRTNQPKKRQTGTQNGTQIAENWNGNLLKIIKMAKRCSFLRGRFFDDYLGGQKSQKKGRGSTKVLLLGSVLQNARGPGEDIGGG